MTGRKAIERKQPTLPMRPGKMERREFEYIRHGTVCLSANFAVATGSLMAPSLLSTRTEQDFCTQIQNTLETAPQAEWIFIVDPLNTHKSEALVRWVASRCDLDEELGVKGEGGILKSMETRLAFLSETSHRIRFIYTPKHTAWLNQIEMWFSI